MVLTRHSRTDFITVHCVKVNLTLKNLINGFCPRVFTNKFME